MNYVNNIPGFQPMQVGGNVSTKYGVGKIVNLYYKNSNGFFVLYATILVAVGTGIIFEQAYNTVVFTGGIGGELSPSSGTGSNL